MKFKKNYTPLFFTTILIFSVHTISSLGQFNWLRPYDPLIVPDVEVCSGFQAIAYAEFGVKNATGYNLKGDPTNPLKIWDDTQDALAMLFGFDQSSPEGKLLLQIDASDIPPRGHLNVCGDLKQDWAFALGARYFFWDHLYISAYIPFFGLKLDDVTWCDLTPDDGDFENTQVRTLLTQNLMDVVHEFDPCLRLCGWKRSGAGDLAAFVGFLKDFPQTRPMLENVGLHGRFGFNFPTGKQQEEDLVFAVPFGYDGSGGIFGSAGIDLTYAGFAQVGFDVELLHLFGITKQRRIKIDPAQTELLLLTKACSYKDPGLVQRFNLYGQLFDFFCGASIKLGYQYYKQGGSLLYLKDCLLSQVIANGARNLEQWTMHHIIGVAEYDFSYHLSQDSRFKPSLSFFTRIPIGGSNIALIPTVGLVCSCAF